MKGGKSMRIRVTCIHKREHHNPHERIVSIGGSNPDGSRWELPESQAIVDIKSGKYDFYVIVGGRTVDVVVAQHLGREYLKTVADNYAPNNLLSLEECPR